MGGEQFLETNHHHLLVSGVIILYLYAHYLILILVHSLSDSREFVQSTRVKKQETEATQETRRQGSRYRKGLRRHLYRHEFVRRQILTSRVDLTDRSKHFWGNTTERARQ